MSLENNVLVLPGGKLHFAGKTYRCSLGKGGLAKTKREGDGVTPVGSWPIRKVLYRPDKLSQSPITLLQVEPIAKDEGWCDDANDPMYNRQVRLPYSASHEELWRNDDVYDVIVVLGYNDDPVIPDKGSAIFMHIARKNYTPTEGCIALSKRDMLEVLEKIDQNTVVNVTLR